MDQASSPNEVYVDELENKEKTEYPEQIAEYEPSGTLRSVTSLPGPPGSEAIFPGLGVDPGSGRIYAAAGGVLKAQLAHGVLILGADIVQPDVASEPATAINTTGATLHGLVEPDLAHGGGDVTSCQFEYVSEQAFQAHGYEHAATAACEASRPLPYPEREPVSAAVALSPSTSYHYRLLAADAAFPTEANDGEAEVRSEETLTTLGPPSVDAQSSSATAARATLTAQIDPHGFNTTCTVQFVDESEFLASGYEHAASVACNQGLGAETSDQPATATLSGLLVGSGYHYRFLASNEQGTTAGADETFATFGLQFVHPRNTRPRRAPLHPGGRCSLSSCARASRSAPTTVRRRRRSGTPKRGSRPG